MPRGIRKPKDPAASPTVQERIRLAERALLSGLTERVLVSEGDLECVASLIKQTGQTKAQLLKKAVRLGLQVLSINPQSEGKVAPEDVTEKFNRLADKISHGEDSPYVGQGDGAGVVNFRTLPLDPRAGFTPAGMPSIVRSGGRNHVDEEVESQPPAAQADESHLPGATIEQPEGTQELPLYDRMREALQAHGPGVVIEATMEEVQSPNIHQEEL